MYVCKFGLMVDQEVYTQYLAIYAWKVKSKVKPL